MRREGLPGVWDAETGAETTQPTEREQAFPGGRSVDCRADQNAVVYDVRTGQQVFELPFPVVCQAFSADGRRLAVGTDRQVRVLDAAETGDKPVQPERILSLPQRPFGPPPPPLP